MDDHARILMCPPDYYGIHYEINPWMKTTRQADHPRAVEQWQQLRRCLEEAHAEIVEVTPVADLPDMVFTANAAVLHGEQAVLARFKHPQRAGEEEHFRRCLESLGLKVASPPGEFAFEGAGDALFCGETLIAGYRQRSDAAGHQEIGAMLGVRVLPLELIDSFFYHLDTCFCPLTSDEAIWYPGAFDPYGQQVIRANVGSLIEVDREEAEQFACNAAVVGRTVVTNTGCPRLHEALAARGYSPQATPLEEFVKAGGSAKCLTLRLDGEESTRS